MTALILCRQLKEFLDIIALKVIYINKIASSIELECALHIKQQPALTRLCHEIPPVIKVLRAFIPIFI